MELGGAGKGAGRSFHERILVEEEVMEEVGEDSVDDWGLCRYLFGNL